MNPLILEIARQVLRWLGVLAMNLPWIPPSFIALTTNEEVILWFAGVVAYALADAGWVMAKIKQWRGRV